MNFRQFQFFTGYSKNIVLSKNVYQRQKAMRKQHDPTKDQIFDENENTQRVMQESKRLMIQGLDRLMKSYNKKAAHVLNDDMTQFHIQIDEMSAALQDEMEMEKNNFDAQHQNISVIARDLAYYNTLRHSVMYQLVCELLMMTTKKDSKRQKLFNEVNRDAKGLLYFVDNARENYYQFFFDTARNVYDLVQKVSSNINIFYVDSPLTYQIISVAYSFYDDIDKMTTKNLINYVNSKAAQQNKTISEKAKKAQFTIAKKQALQRFFEVIPFETDQELIMFHATLGFFFNQMRRIKSLLENYFDRTVQNGLAHEQKQDIDLYFQASPNQDGVCQFEDRNPEYIKILADQRRAGASHFKMMRDLDDRIIYMFTYANYVLSQLKQHHFQKQVVLSPLKYPGLQYYDFSRIAKLINFKYAHIFIPMPVINQWYNARSREIFKTNKIYVTYRNAINARERAIGDNYFANFDRYGIRIDGPPPQVQKKKKLAERVLVDDDENNNNLHMRMLSRKEDLAYQRINKKKRIVNRVNRSYDRRILPTESSSSARYSSVRPAKEESKVNNNNKNKNFTFQSMSDDEEGGGSYEMQESSILNIAPQNIETSGDQYEQNLSQAQKDILQFQQSSTNSFARSINPESVRHSIIEFLDGRTPYNQIRVKNFRLMRNKLKLSEELKQDFVTQQQLGTFIEEQLQRIQFQIEKYYAIYEQLQQTNIRGQAQFQNQMQQMKQQLEQEAKMQVQQMTSMLPDNNLSQRSAHSESAQVLLRLNTIMEQENYGDSSSLQLSSDQNYNSKRNLPAISSGSGNMSLSSQNNGADNNHNMPVLWSEIVSTVSPLSESQQKYLFIQFNPSADNNNNNNRAATQNNIMQEEYYDEDVLQPDDNNNTTYSFDLFTQISTALQQFQLFASLQYVRNAAMSTNNFTQVKQELHTILRNKIKSGQLFQYSVSAAIIKNQNNNVPTVGLPAVQNKLLNDIQNNTNFITSQYIPLSLDAKSYLHSTAINKMMYAGEQYNFTQEEQDPLIDFQILLTGVHDFTQKIQRLQNFLNPVLSKIAVTGRSEQLTQIWQLYVKDFNNNSNDNANQEEIKKQLIAQAEQIQDSLNSSTSARIREYFKSQDIFVNRILNLLFLILFIDDMESQFNQQKKMRMMQQSQQNPSNYNSSMFQPLLQQQDNNIRSGGISNNNLQPSSSASNLQQQFFQQQMNPSTQLKDSFRFLKNLVHEIDGQNGASNKYQQSGLGITLALTQQIQQILSAKNRNKDIADDENIFLPQARNQQQSVYDLINLDPSMQALQQFKHTLKELLSLENVGARARISLEDDEIKLMMRYLRAEVYKLIHDITVQNGSLNSDQMQKHFKNFYLKHQKGFVQLTSLSDINTLVRQTEVVILDLLRKKIQLLNLQKTFSLGQYGAQQKFQAELNFQESSIQQRPEEEEKNNDSYNLDQLLDLQFNSREPKSLQAMQTQTDFTIQRINDFNIQNFLGDQKQRKGATGYRFQYKSDEEDGSDDDDADQSGINFFPDRSVDDDDDQQLQAQLSFLFKNDDESQAPVGRAHIKHILKKIKSYLDWRNKHIINFLEEYHRNEQLTHEYYLKKSQIDTRPNAYGIEKDHSSHANNSLFNETDLASLNIILQMDQDQLLPDYQPSEVEKNEIDYLNQLFKEDAALFSQQLESFLKKIQQQSRAIYQQLTQSNAVSYQRVVELLKNIQEFLKSNSAHLQDQDSQAVDLDQLLFTLDSSHNYIINLPRFLDFLYNQLDQIQQLQMENKFRNNELQNQLNLEKEYNKQSQDFKLRMQEEKQNLINQIDQQLARLNQAEETLRQKEHQINDLTNAQNTLNANLNEKIQYIMNADIDLAAANQTIKQLQAKVDQLKQELEQSRQSATIQSSSQSLSNTEKKKLQQQINDLQRQIQTQQQQQISQKSEYDKKLNALQEQKNIFHYRLIGLKILYHAETLAQMLINQHFTDHSVRHTISNQSLETVIPFIQPLSALLQATQQDLKQVLLKQGLNEIFNKFSMNFFTETQLLPALFLNTTGSQQKISRSVIAAFLENQFARDQQKKDAVLSCADRMAPMVYVFLKQHSSSLLQDQNNLPHNMPVFQNQQGMQLLPQLLSQRTLWFNAIQLFFNLHRSVLLLTEPQLLDTNGRLAANFIALENAGDDQLFVASELKNTAAYKNLLASHRQNTKKFSQFTDQIQQQSQLISAVENAISETKLVQDELQKKQMTLLQQLAESELQVREINQSFDQIKDILVQYMLPSQIKFYKLILESWIPELKNVLQAVGLQYAAIQSKIVSLHEDDTKTNVQRFQAAINSQDQENVHQQIIKQTQLQKTIKDHQNKFTQLIKTPMQNLDNQAARLNQLILNYTNIQQEASIKINHASVLKTIHEDQQMIQQIQMQINSLYTIISVSYQEANLFLSEHNIKIVDVFKQQQDSLAQLRQNMDRAIADLKKQNRTEISDLKKTHDTRLQEITASLQLKQAETETLKQEILKINQQNIQTTQANSKEIHVLNEKLKNNDDILKQTTHEYLQYKQETESQVTSLKSQLSENRDKMRQFQVQAEQLQHIQAAQLEELKKQQQEQLTSTNLQIVQNQIKYTQELEQKEQNLQINLQKISSLNDKIQQLNETAQQKEQEIAGYKNSTAQQLLANSQTILQQKEQLINLQHLNELLNDQSLHIKQQVASLIQENDSITLNLQQYQSKYIEQVNVNTISKKLSEEQLAQITVQISAQILEREQLAQQVLKLQMALDEQKDIGASVYENFITTANKLQILQQQYTDLQLQQQQLLQTINPQQQLIGNENAEQVIRNNNTNVQNNLQQIVNQANEKQASSVYASLDNQGSIHIIEDTIEQIMQREMKSTIETTQLFIQDKLNKQYSLLQTEAQQVQTDQMIANKFMFAQSFFGIDILKEGAQLDEQLNSVEPGAQDYNSAGTENNHSIHQAASIYFSDHSIQLDATIFISFIEDIIQLYYDLNAQNQLLQFIAQYTTQASQQQVILAMWQSWAHKQVNKKQDGQLAILSKFTGLIDKIQRLMSQILNPNIKKSNSISIDNITKVIVSILNQIRCKDPVSMLCSTFSTTLLRQKLRPAFAQTDQQNINNNNNFSHDSLIDYEQIRQNLNILQAVDNNLKQQQQSSDDDLKQAVIGNIGNFFASDPSTTRNANQKSMLDNQKITSEKFEQIQAFNNKVSDINNEILSRILNDSIKRYGVGGKAISPTQFEISIGDYLSLDPQLSQAARRLRTLHTFEFIRKRHDLKFNRFVPSFDRSQFTLSTPYVVIQQQVTTQNQMSNHNDDLHLSFTFTEKQKIQESTEANVGDLHKDEFLAEYVDEDQFQIYKKWLVQILLQQQTVQSIFLKLPLLEQSKVIKNFELSNNLDNSGVLSDNLLSKSERLREYLMSSSDSQLEIQSRILNNSSFAAVNNLTQLHEIVVNFCIPTFKFNYICIDQITPAEEQQNEPTDLQTQNQKQLLSDINSSIYFKQQLYLQTQNTFEALVDSIIPQITEHIQLQETLSSNLKTHQSHTLKDVQQYAQADSLDKIAANYPMIKWFTMDYEQDLDSKIDTPAMEDESAAVVKKDVCQQIFDQNKLITVLDTTLKTESQLNLQLVPTKSASYNIIIQYTKNYYTTPQSNPSSNGTIIMDFAVFLKHFVESPHRLKTFIALNYLADFITPFMSANVSNDFLSQRDNIVQYDQFRTPEFKKQLHTRLLNSRLDIAEQSLLQFANSTQNLFISEDFISAFQTIKRHWNKGTQLQSIDNEDNLAFNNLLYTMQFEVVKYYNDYLEPIQDCYNAKFYSEQSALRFSTSGLTKFPFQGLFDFFQPNPNIYILYESASDFQNQANFLAQNQQTKKFNSPNSYYYYIPIKDQSRAVFIQRNQAMFSSKMNIKNLIHLLYVNNNINHTLTSTKSLDNQQKFIQSFYPTHQIRNTNYVKLQQDIIQFDWLIHDNLSINSRYYNLYINRQKITKDLYYLTTFYTHGFLQQFSMMSALEDSINDKIKQISIGQQQALAKNTSKFATIHRHSIEKVHSILDRNFKKVFLFFFRGMQFNEALQNYTTYFLTRSVQLPQILLDQITQQSTQSTSLLNLYQYLDFDFTSSSIQTTEIIKALRYLITFKAQQIPENQIKQSFLQEGMSEQIYKYVVGMYNSFTFLTENFANNTNAGQSYYANTTLRDIISMCRDVKPNSYYLGLKFWYEIGAGQQQLQKQYQMISEDNNDDEDDDNIFEQQGFGKIQNTSDWLINKKKKTIKNMSAVKALKDYEKRLLQHLHENVALISSNFNELFNLEIAASRAYMRQDQWSDIVSQYTAQYHEHTKKQFLIPKHDNLSYADYVYYKTGIKYFDPTIA